MTANIDEMPEEVRQYKDQLEGRAMLVKKAEVIPLEAIVRGYLTGVHHGTISGTSSNLTLLGSAWKEYRQSGTVHRTKQEPGLVEFQKFPELRWPRNTMLVSDQPSSRLERKVENAADAQRRLSRKA